jgi:hypothetical protein
MFSRVADKPRAPFPGRLSEITRRADATRMPPRSEEIQADPIGLPPAAYSTGASLSRSWIEIALPVSMPW